MLRVVIMIVSYRVITTHCPQEFNYDMQHQDTWSTVRSIVWGLGNLRALKMRLQNAWYWTCAETFQLAPTLQYSFSRLLLSIYMLKESHLSLRTFLEWNMYETGCWYGESRRHFLADEGSGNLVTEVINGVRKRKYSTEMTWFVSCTKRTNSSVRGFFEKLLIKGWANRLRIYGIWIFIAVVSNFCSLNFFLVSWIRYNQCNSLPYDAFWYYLICA